MKKIIALVLCIVMMVSLVPTSFAAERNFSMENDLATRLKALGVFNGVSATDFALGRAPSRAEAITMLVRLLGKEADALENGGEHPFTDVPQWADKYVGYAYVNKLTNGVSDTLFGSADSTSAAMYITFVLRALGYSDAEGDFVWNAPFELAEKAGLLVGNPDRENFLRADVVLVSYAALGNPPKNETKTLGEKLVEMGVFTKEAFAENYDHSVIIRRPAVTDSEEPDSEQIYKDLAAYVMEHANTKMAGMPAISAKSGDNGDMAFYVSYESESGTFYFTNTIESGSTRSAMTIAFNSKNDECRYGYNMYFTDDGSEILSIVGSLKKSDFCEDMKIEGMNIEMKQKTTDDEYVKSFALAEAPLMAYNVLLLPQTIFKNKIPEYAEIGLKGLGFINFPVK